MPADPNPIAALIAAGSGRYSAITESDAKPPRARSEARDVLIGTILDRRFRIDERIAAGGFGAIYRATHVKSGYQVAIKVLHPHMYADPRTVARFKREGATLTTLRDPHTVTTYELAEDANGILFIVMELLAGETLFARYRARGRLPWREVTAIAREVCQSLAEAHALGIVHRDLKPGNIFLCARPDGGEVVKVLDFGIAKLLDDGGDDLTKNNEVVGTFEYISPEQVKGSAYSGRSDIYTLAVVMYEMIVGERPFASVPGPALLVAILEDRPPLISTHLPDIPRELDRMIARCLEPDPAARFADVGALAAALDDLGARGPVASPDTTDELTNIVARPPVEPMTAIAPNPRGLPYATPLPLPIVQIMPPQPASLYPTLEGGWIAPQRPVVPPPPAELPPPPSNRLWLLLILAGAIALGVLVALLAG